MAATLPAIAPLVPAMSEILVPVSFGELLDKITILQIKSERISDAGKLANVRKELAALEATWSTHPAADMDIRALHAELKAVNEQLWDIEDDIRLKDKAQTFDEGFVELARSVYFRNDERARIKKAINLALGSGYVDEKSYADYGTRRAARRCRSKVSRVDAFPLKSLGPRFTPAPAKTLSSGNQPRNARTRRRHRPR